MIVTNMPGAASMIAANRVYAMQPGDGLTIVVFSYGAIPLAVTGGPGDPVRPAQVPLAW